LFYHLAFPKFVDIVQMELINECSLRFAEDKDFRLLIIDSIMALFRVDYSGRGELSERQQKLGQMLSKLTKLSEEYNVCFFFALFNACLFLNHLIYRLRFYSQIKFNLILVQP